MDYHNDLSAISKSGLDLINKAPYMYKYVKTERNEIKPTKALTIGSGYHEYILERDNFFLRWCVSNRPTEGNNLNMKDFQALQVIASKLERLPEFIEAMDGGMVEHTVKAVDPNTGMNIKCRTDIWNPKNRNIYDLKFVEDASPNGFERHVRKFRYHVQDAFYKHVFEQAGMEVEQFIFIAIEKKPPYLIGVYVLSFDKIMDGQESFRYDLDTYAECMRTDTWPEHTVGVLEI